MLISFLSRLCAADAGGGAGDPAPPREKATPSGLLERYGNDALKLAEKLATAQESAYAAQEKLATATRELEAARAKAAPEGSAILSADDAKVWTAYTALGKPDDLTKAIADRDAAQAELTTVTRGLALHAAADAHGYKVSVLGKLPSLAGKEVIVKDVTEGEATVKRAFVKDGDTELGLTDYITKHDPELLPALAIEAAGTQRAAGTPYPAQSGNGRPPPATNAAQAYIKKANYALPKQAEA